MPPLSWTFIVCRNVVVRHSITSWTFIQFVLGRVWGCMLTVIGMHCSDIRDNIASMAMGKQGSGSPPAMTMDCDSTPYQTGQKVPPFHRDAIENSTFPMYLLHSASYKMMAKLIDDQTTTSRDQGHGTNMQRPMWSVEDQNHNAWREKRIDGRFLIFHSNNFKCDAGDARDAMRCDAEYITPGDQYILFDVIQYNAMQYIVMP